MLEILRTVAIVVGYWIAASLSAVGVWMLLKQTAFLYRRRQIRKRLREVCPTYRDYVEPRDRPWLRHQQPVRRGGKDAA